MIQHICNNELRDLKTNNFILGNFELINSKIIIGGVNNVVVLNNSIIKNSIIHMRNSNSIVIVNKSNMNAVNPLILSENVVFTLGSNFTSGKTHIRVGDANIHIGNDVMFSQDIYIQNHDGHSIYDIDTNKILTRGKPIIIGHHVWVGYHVTILKGTTISSGSVVGACSILLNKKFKQNSIIAGQPASIIKDNIFWTREGIHILNSSEKSNRLIYKKNNSSFIFNKDSYVSGITALDARLNLITSNREKLTILAEFMNLDFDFSKENIL